jgi:hypothetical protein
MFTSDRTTRSLSVGDFVKLDDKWYRCASFGWDEASTEDVDRWFDAMDERRRLRQPGRDWMEERQLLWSDKRRVEDMLGVGGF